MLYQIYTYFAQCNEQALFLFIKENSQDSEHYNVLYYSPGEPIKFQVDTNTRFMECIKKCKTMMYVSIINYVCGSQECNNLSKRLNNNRNGCVLSGFRFWHFG